MNIFNLPVHPAAAIFPMLDEEELNELAEDIKANGLIHPLIVKDGQLIDGRNRREACKRVGIVPPVSELDGQDPASYILSANIARRHMNKGQQAMAVAMLFPEKHQGKKSTSPKIGEVKEEYLRMARTVLTQTPEVAQEVLAGRAKLVDAYERAKALDEETETLPRRMNKLKQADLALAEQVTEGRMSIDEAEEQLKSKLEAARLRRQAWWNFFQAMDNYRLLLQQPNQIADAVASLREHPQEWPIRERGPAELLDILISGFERMKAGLT
jgi:ParB-like chromosome segregation protein Spo0J